MRQQCLFEIGIIKSILVPLSVMHLQGHLSRPLKHIRDITRVNDVYNTVSGVKKYLVFSNISAPSLTDDKFINRQYPEHHVGISPLQQLKCGMVSGFPLDYMHLVCLGVIRRLLNLWIHGTRAVKL